MADKRFDWDYKAAGNLMLKSVEIAEICEKEAAKMTRATGIEYVPDVRVGKNRVKAAGYQMLPKHNGKSGVCPKCGHWHPNCDCGNAGK